MCLAERVTASAIARRALQRSLAEDTSALADLVSQGALDASSSSSSSSEGGSGGESDGSSDGDAGAGASVASLRAALAALRRDQRRMKRVMAVQQRVIGAQHEMLAAREAVAASPLHADLAPFHAATARRLPRLDSSSRRALESALPRVADFCAWVPAEPAFAALLAEARATAPPLVSSVGASLARRVLRLAESIAGLYGLVAEPEPPSDADLRAALVSLFRLALGVTADIDAAARDAGLRAVSARKPPASVLQDTGHDAVIADADLHRLMDERRVVASLTPLVRPVRRSGSAAAPAPAAASGLSKAKRRRMRRQKAAGGGASSAPAAPAASSGEGGSSPARKGKGGHGRGKSAGGRSVRQ